ncbi:predicted protein [Plenodomus lingam JN3]|uniref:Predicted protein n=2 Tax=Leptosphaeria maculans TaxID=5022 RepID=E5A3L5_LEPMJ|nr:predicted protein [Plenodomus lingam JN3]CBX98228.1 predicted protein [Plenodomus lingam JN3]
MLFYCLVSCLFLCRTISALELPYNHGQQQPLHPSKQSSRVNKDSARGTVLLGYKETGSDVEKAIEIPWGTRIPSGMHALLKSKRTSVLTICPGRNLPVHPKTLRVLTAANNLGQAMPLERLEKIVCYLEPKMTANNREAVELAMGRKSWEGVSLGDGIVEFERSDSKWFLRGIGVSAYQCW